APGDGTTQPAQLPRSVSPEVRFQRPPPHRSSQVAGMAENSANLLRSSGAVPGPPPTVRLELRHGSAPATIHEMTDVGFLIGSVPGCDLRLPGANLPPVICLIARCAGRVLLRRLAP